MHADNDLLIVRELRKMSSLSKRGEKVAPRASEEELKWLNWPDFVQVLNFISHKHTQGSSLHSDDTHALKGVCIC